MHSTAFPKIFHANDSDAALSAMQEQWANCSQKAPAALPKRTTRIARFPGMLNISSPRPGYWASAATVKSVKFLPGHRHFAL